MMDRRAYVLALLLAACGSEAEPPPALPPADDCQPPGVQLPDGACVEVGVAEGDCGEGFEADGQGGCVAVLPADPCPPGQLPVIGQVACQAIALCGEPPWGDIPLEPNTQHVDESYPGADSDGSEARPWLRVQDGIDAAVPHAIVAVAAGRYHEDLVIRRAVRLWGRCPEQVQLVGGVDQAATVGIVDSLAAGTEIRAVAIESAELGIFVSGATDVLLEQLWIHDTAARGINAQDTLGPTSLTVRDTLVEGATEMGLFVGGLSADLERTALLDTRPTASGATGAGAYIEATATPAMLRASAVIVEGSSKVGIAVGASDLVLERSVIRDTLVEPTTQGFGRGLSIEARASGGSQAAVHQSVFERNHQAGVYVSGSAVTLTSITVREVFLSPDGTDGAGISIINSLEHGLPSDALIDGASIDGAHSLGILAGGSTVRFASVRVADTQPDGAGALGRGILLQASPDDFEPTTFDIERAVIERCSDVGVLTLLSDGEIRDTWVDHTATRSSDGLFGDGLTIVAAPTEVSVRNTRVQRSHRAGLANFSSALRLQGNHLSCNGIDLNAEAIDQRPFSFIDEGLNLCGCEQEASCVAASSGLLPPDPL